MRLSLSLYLFLSLSLYIYICIDTYCICGTICYNKRSLVGRLSTLGFSPGMVWIATSLTELSSAVPLVLQRAAPATEASGWILCRSCLPAILPAALQQSRLCVKGL